MSTSVGLDSQTPKVYQYSANEFTLSVNTRRISEFGLFPLAAKNGIILNSTLGKDGKPK
jgi:hypothetical protein